jgi:hypothetical protein
MFTIEEYLQRRRNYLERHALQLQILQECHQALQAERPTRRRNFWWNQPPTPLSFLTFPNWKTTFHSVNINLLREAST